jgi:hypothetical protein
MNPERLGCRDLVGLRIPLATRESPQCLHAGSSWSAIQAAFACSRATIAKVAKRPA